MNPEALRKLFKYAVLNDKEYRHWVLERLYDLQTPNEQARQLTQDRNGAGFTAPDAPVLSLLAEKLADGGKLTTADETLLKWRLQKYTAQFTETRLMDPADRKPPSSAVTESNPKSQRRAE